jgi:hypothetical protein
VRVLCADVAPVKIQNGLSYDQVLFLGDIFPTGWQAVVQECLDLPLSLIVLGPGREQF